MVRFAVSFPVLYLRKTILSLSSKRFNDCIYKKQHFFTFFMANLCPKLSGRGRKDLRIKRL